jgi:hypothetical protein
MTAAFTFLIDGESVPLPKGDDPFQLEYMNLGTSSRMANGRMRTQIVTQKIRIRISWTGLTWSERSQLLRLFMASSATAKVFALPDGQTLSALTGTGTWSESHEYNPFLHVVFYNVSFTIEQE